MESADTLTVALTRPLDGFTSMDGYIMPVRITSASGYDAQVDYSKRVSYLTLDVTQENGVGFEEGKNSVWLQETKVSPDTICRLWLILRQTMI